MRALAIILGVVAALAAAFVVADSWARQQVADYVTAKVREVLELETAQPVAVEIAGFSIIAQMITGKLDEVNVGVDNVTIGDLTGDVSLRAEGIPVDLSAPVEQVHLEFAVSEASIQSIAKFLTATAIDDVQLVDAEIQFASQFTVFGFPIDVGVGVEPFADSGKIGFTPSSVELNGNRTSVRALSENYGSVVDALFRTQAVCVARWLPEALELEQVVVRDEQLVVTIGADKAILDEAALATFGTCEA